MAVGTELDLANSLGGGFGPRHSATMRTRAASPTETTCHLKDYRTRNTGPTSQRSKERRTKGDATKRGSGQNTSFRAPLVAASFTATT